MDAKKLTEAILKAKNDIVREVYDRLPRKVGVIATNHFRQNFRNSGFMDGGNHPWLPSKRQLENGKDSKYGTLLSRRNHLMMSITSIPGVGEVTIRNDVPYAQIHNEGGQFDIHPTVTAKLRRFAWYKVYSLSGIKKSKGKKGKLPKQLSPEAEVWKAIALTKKQKLNIHINMPQRQFIGESKELREKIEAEIKASIERIEASVLRFT